MVAPSDRRVYYTTLASNGYHPTGRTTPGAGNQYAREICIPPSHFFSSHQQDAMAEAPESHSPLGILSEYVARRTRVRAPMHNHF